LGAFAGWRVRKGSGLRSFSDGLVIQGRRRGVLDLSVCRLATGGSAPEALQLLRPLAAACTSEGIRRDTGVVSWLYWPNLVTVDGRVVATTSVSVSPLPGSEAKRVVFGVSVSCSRTEPAFSPQLPATSILGVLGARIDPDLLRDKVLHALDWYFAEWERGMHRKLARRMEPTVAWLGHDVEVRTADAKVLKGRADGLDDQGSLLLEQRARTLAVPPDSVRLVVAVK
jgi:biotin-(acetyl-CoA carboxylase) ligase